MQRTEEISHHVEYHAKAALVLHDESLGLLLWRVSHWGRKFNRFKRCSTCIIMYLKNSKMLGLVSAAVHADSMTEVQSSCTPLRSACADGSCFFRIFEAWQYPLIKFETFEFWRRFFCQVRVSKFYEYLFGSFLALMPHHHGKPSSQFSTSQEHG